ncbi:MAG: hypothetical protein ACOCV1_02550 [Bacillota bacterium]
MEQRALIDMNGLKNCSAQSFLKWFEQKYGSKVCLKIYSDGSGKVESEEEEKVLLEFSDSRELYNIVNQLYERKSNE